MAISAKGLELIKRWEGCRLTAYKCPAGVWTIGYGITGTITLNGKQVKVQEGLKITQKQADDSFLIKLKPYINAVDKNIKVEITQGMKDAVYSLSYNCGTNQKILYNLINTYQFDKALDSLKSHNKAKVNGVLTVLQGLVNRRNEEAKLWITNMYLKPKSEVYPNANPLYIRWCQIRLNEFAKKNKISKYVNLVVDGDFGNNTRKMNNVVRKWLGWKQFDNDSKNRFTMNMIEKIS